MTIKAPLGPHATLSYSDTGVETLIETGGMMPLFRSLVETWGIRDHRPMDLGHFANVIRLGSMSIAISTDGVGTKAMIAQLMEIYTDIGVDCVAMNVNDILCVGAVPQTMVDYLAIEKADENVLADIGVGLLKGAKQAKITIVGGETAQIPEMIRGETTDSGFDLVGTAIGTVEPDRVIDGNAIRPNDIIVGLQSNGVHSNGFTLVREAFGIRGDKDTQEKTRVLNQHSEELGCRLGEELLKPSKIYVREICEALDEGLDIRGLAHITSDGFLNLPRLIADVSYEIDSLPETQPIFKLIQNNGRQITDEEMFHVFNMGIGLCAILPEGEADRLIEICKYHDTFASKIGHVTHGDRRTVRLPQFGLIGERGEGFKKEA